MIVLNAVSGGRAMVQLGCQSLGCLKTGLRFFTE